MEADYSRARDQVVQTFQRDTQATKAEYEQTKKQNDEQLKKDTRRAKKAKEETGWQALAMFEGQRDEGIKWRRGTDAELERRDRRSCTRSRLTRNTFSNDAAGWRTPLRRGRRDRDVRPRAAAAPAEGLSPRTRCSRERACRSRQAPSRRSPPVEETPLVTLQGLRAGIEEQLIALEALKLPKFLKIDIFIWPWLLLGGAAAAGLGFGTPVGWTTAGIVGGVVAVASGVGAYLGLSSMARPSVAKHSVPLRRDLADAEQLVEREKDWIKNKFDGKIKELEKKRETMVRDAEDLLGRRVSEFQSRHQKQTEEADKTYPRGSSKSAFAATKGSRRPRNTIRPESRL